MFFMELVPTKFFFTQGTGYHEKEIRAFEEALRDAKIEMLNLVKVSSVIPPGCKKISRQEGMRLMKPGQIAFAVQAESQTNEPGQIISAGIAMAQPEDDRIHGYMTELEGVIGRTKEDVIQDVEEMAIENLITKLGINKDGDNIIKKGKKNYSVQGKKFNVDHIVEIAKGHEDRLYTVVIAAAIFLFE
jgi:arginine decarboxylase